MDKQKQIEELQQQLQQRANQLIAADHLAGKISGAIELLTAQIAEEESDASKKEEEVKAN